MTDNLMLMSGFLLASWAFFKVVKAGDAVDMKTRHFLAIGLAISLWAYWVFSQVEKALVESIR